MMRGLALLVALGMLAGPQLARAEATKSSPEQDMKAFQAYFTNKFPKVPLKDFVNGPYSMNEGLRKQRIEKVTLPPYDFALDHGKELFTKPIKNRNTLHQCIPNKRIRIP